MADHEYLTPEELAERYRRSPHTIRRWLRAGLFGDKARKSPGGGWLIRADATEPNTKPQDDTP